MSTTRPSLGYWARNKIGTALLPLALLIATPALSDPTDDYNAGVAAFEAGDYTAALGHWLPLAQSGDIDAQRNVGLLYQTGRGVPLDLGVAFYWFRLSAEAGNASSANSVAMMYLTGEGLPSDYVAAAAWLSRAASAGYGPAQFNLGLLYERGIGVEQDDQTALGWYVLAAESGQAGAVARITLLRGRLAELTAAPPPTRAARQQLELAWAIVRGLVTLQTEVEATRPRALATGEGGAIAAAASSAGTPNLLELLLPPVSPVLVAEAAEAKAGFNRIALGDRIARGRAAFERKEGGAAMAALLPAALAGDADSQYLIGRLYEGGLGVPTDLAEAVSWWALAAVQGHGEAAAAVERVGAALDAPQVERVTRLWALRAPPSYVPPAPRPLAPPPCNGCAMLHIPSIGSRFWVQLVE